MKASVSATSLYDLTPGRRVIVKSPDWLAGQPAIVIDMPHGLLNGHDCAVVFEDDEVMCMYVHELTVEK